MTFMLLQYERDCRDRVLKGSEYYSSKRKRNASYKAGRTAKRSAVNCYSELEKRFQKTVANHVYL